LVGINNQKFDWGFRFFYQYKTMNTDASAQSMVSMQEVDENMSLVQKNVSLIIDVHQNEINKLKKQLREEQERNNEREEDIIENYFANMKLRETTWKEWERMEERNKLLEAENEELKEDLSVWEACEEWKAQQKAEEEQRRQAWLRKM
jgi:hypothetical protein